MCACIIYYILIYTYLLDTYSQGQASHRVSTMQYFPAYSVQLLLVVCSAAVCVYGSNCDKFTYCEDIVEILKAIKSYPDNYQQLLNVFYPINQARPSSVIIAYFTNYTDPLPQECEQGTYPWKTYPNTNSKYWRTEWYLWTTTPIYHMGTSLDLQEFGEYLPTATYCLLLNKTSPFVLPTQTACIKIPFYLSRELFDGSGKATLGELTMQVGYTVGPHLSATRVSSFLAYIPYKCK